MNSLWKELFPQLQYFRRVKSRVIITAINDEMASHSDFDKVDENKKYLLWISTSKERIKDLLNLKIILTYKGTQQVGHDMERNQRKCKKQRRVEKAWQI